MNSTEKIIIKKIINNLESSSYRNFNSGDIDDWRDYARRMKNGVDNSISMLHGLIEASEVEEDPKNEKNILSAEEFLAKNLEP